MREILFRAKQKDKGNWVEGYYIRQDETTYCFKEDYERHPENTKHYIVFDMPTDWGIPNRHLIAEIDPETLCQYTGLTDKNGNRIWENDIVGAWSEGKHTIGRVKRRVDGLYIIYPSYQKQEFWGLCPDENGKTTVEVIGNILDNPELLKGE